MVVEVANANKEEEKSNEHVEENVAPPQFHIQVPEFPKQDKNKQKKACCVSLLFLLVIGLIAACIFLGLRSHYYHDRYEAALRRRSGSSINLHLYQPSKDLRLDAVTRGQWQQAADVIASDCIRNLEELAVDIEANGEEDIIDENLYKIDAKCLELKMRSLQRRVRG